MEKEEKNEKSINPFLKYLYVFFVVIGFVYIYKHQFMDATMYLGLALAFDPFDVNQPWKERPIWQKGWLIIHLALVALLFGYGIGVDSK